MMAKVNRISQLTLNESSPEKAGVGGSIPSLATTFSNTYRPSTPSFGSNSSPPMRHLACDRLLQIVPITDTRTQWKTNLLNTPPSRTTKWLDSTICDCRKRGEILRSFLVSSLHQRTIMNSTNCSLI
jgi:hypothetical protein